MKLDTQMKAFDRARWGLLDELGVLEPDKLVARPLPGKWSILEIVEHMVLAERTVLQGLPEAAQSKEREPRLKHQLRYLLVLAVLKARIPVKVPALAMAPTGTGDLAHWRRLWDENQAWLRTYIEDRAARSARGTALRHPVAGPISVEHGVLMSQLHLTIHTRQIRALLRLLQP